MSSNKSFPPIYTELAQEASEKLRQVLPLVNKYKTPITPVNYAVWYEYVSGTNNALCDDINNRLSAKAPLTPQVTQSLFEKHVLFDMPNRLEKTNSGIKLVVDNTLNNLSKAESTTNQCSAGFTNSQTALENCSDLESLKSVINELITNTKTLNDSSIDLKQGLEASSLEIKKLKAELEAVKQIARIDGLTGLLNRTAFDKELALICKGSTKKLSLAIFDIDNFKKLNDTFGHLLGDKVLQFFSSIVKRHAGHQHTAARFGGEEIVLIIVGLSDEQVLALTDLIRTTLEKSNLKQRNSDEGIGQVTTSVGISHYKPDDTPLELIGRADKALYQAKAEGRNCIRTA
jgi:diguanylate cyclase